MATSENLGRVRGAGMFTTTAASGTSVASGTISPTNISPLVGDSVIFPNGDVRRVTAVSGGTITCGNVVTSIKGEKGAAGANGTNGQDGITPHFTVSVESIKAGETPKVEQNGDSGNISLLFSLPQGFNGAGLRNIGQNDSGSTTGITVNQKMSKDGVYFVKVKDSGSSQQIVPLTFYSEDTTAMYGQFYGFDILGTSFAGFKAVCSYNKNTKQISITSKYAFELNQSGLSEYTPTITLYAVYSANPADKVSEAKTIQTWSENSNIAPFTHSANVSISTSIDATKTVELINNQAVLFAKHGFAIGAISGQTVTIYSIGAPESSVTLSFEIGG